MQCGASLCLCSNMLVCVMLGHYDAIGMHMNLRDMHRYAGKQCTAADATHTLICSLPTQPSTLLFMELKRVQSSRRLGVLMMHTLMRASASRYCCSWCCSWCFQRSSLFVCCNIHQHHHQVITKLLYLLNQGETFTKVRVLSYGCTCGYASLYTRTPTHKSHRKKHPRCFSVPPSFFKTRMPTCDAWSTSSSKSSPPRRTR